MTLLWHYYNHYDRVSAPSLSECADSSPLSEHGEMIINWPWSLELDFNQQVGAQLSWEAAEVSCPVLWYTLYHYTVYCRCLTRIAAALKCPPHCRYAGDNFLCHFKLRKHQGSCSWFQKGRNCAVMWLLFAFITLLFHLFKKLYTLLQNQNLQFGLVFVEKTRPKAFTITQDQSQ